MKRNQTFHETLIPLLIDGLGIRTYLEFGTHLNETIGRVRCPVRIGVDLRPVPCEGARMFAMTTQKFIEKEAADLAPFDVVFVDADHSAASILEDVEGIWKFVSEEGLVLLHDVNPETWADTEPGLCGDGWRAAQDLVSAWKEMVVLPYHPGLAIMRRRIKWGPQ